MADTVLQFGASLPFDKRLAYCDIRGSIAHVKMLSKCMILNPEEAEEIIGGLKEIRSEIEEGRFVYDLAFEDIHMNIEKRLIELLGPLGGKMHTARSRNDQVALDMHLYIKEETGLIDNLLKQLQQTFIDLAENLMGVIVPGYTHLQRAQPLLLSHHLLTYYWMLERDRDRLAGVYQRADLMPLGAGALAGTGFKIDREIVARELNFRELYENSIDAVSDRDYIVEFLAFASLLLMHLSRLCEELVIWSSTEFGFVELDDAFTTGSSMMPQKKNPDVAELIRGKTGRIYGSLLAMLTVMKGLPLAYNKDMQEDKEGLFDAVDTIKILLPPLIGMLKTMKINNSRLSAAVNDDYLCATDLADYLVQQGVSFRDAHHIVGGMIACCREEKIRLLDLDAERRSGFHPALAKNIAELFDPQKVVEARQSRGGTASLAVLKQLEIARKRLAKS